MNEEPVLAADNQTVRCKSCSEIVGTDDQFCQSCGFPLKGTESEQSIFTYRRQFKQIELNELNKKINTAGTTLYVLAGFSLLFAVGYFFINPGSNSASAVLVTYGIVAIIFLLLGYWSKQKPVAAIVSGTVLYVLIQVMGIIQNPSSILSGLLIKIFVIIYLLKGMQSAFEAEKIRKQHNI